MTLGITTITIKAKAQILAEKNVIALKHSAKEEKMWHLA
jgi:hypothetical protein